MNAIETEGIMGEKAAKTTSSRWDIEKEQLLKTHPNWFVAYQDGKRVALEPTLDRLVAAMDEKLGSPRKPCEFHEIIEQPTVKRGPSPRFWPGRADT